MIYRTSIILGFTLCTYLVVQDLAGLRTQGTNGKSVVREVAVVPSPEEKKILKELTLQKKKVSDSLSVSEEIVKHNNWMVSKTTIATVRRHLSLFSEKSSPEEVKAMRADLNPLSRLLKELQLSPNLELQVNKLDQHLQKLEEIHRSYYKVQSKDLRPMIQNSPSHAKTANPLSWAALVTMSGLFLFQFFNRNKNEAKSEVLSPVKPELKPNPMQTPIPLKAVKNDLIEFGEVMENIMASVSSEAQAQGISVNMQGAGEGLISKAQADNFGAFGDLLKLLFTVVSAQPLFEKKISIILHQSANKQIVSIILSGCPFTEELLSLKLTPEMTFERRLLTFEHELNLAAGSLKVQNHFLHSGSLMHVSLDIEISKTTPYLVEQRA